MLAPIDANRAAMMSRSCAFSGCPRVVSAKGLCAAHYQQRAKGYPLSAVRKKRGNGVVKEMVASGLIECRECGESKRIAEYSPVNAMGMPRPYCKPCNAELVRLEQYNVTKEFLRLLLLRQDGRCAVCREVDRSGRAMDIDHDHACCAGRRSCGECVRGLVCNRCNVHALAWYEALRSELRTFDLLNAYLTNPPARRLRAEYAV
ncbi:endonuclease domain-containing protein [Streptomyces sp. L2]|uniref:endonuclease domain-containing protein n=1 Tax=Streptomyces sp. L2 TaxID=2162665 RepID=UPI0013E91B4A|nr:endonuclease domain-containing protein [Streptomyces sp. L2]